MRHFCQGASFFRMLCHQIPCFVFQKLFVITAFNENLVDAAVSHIHRVPWIGPKLEAPFKELLVKQKEKLHRKVGVEAATVSQQSWDKIDRVDNNNKNFQCVNNNLMSKNEMKMFDTFSRITFNGPPFILRKKSLLRHIYIFVSLYSI